MSSFLYHEGCPQCGSSDALAVFDDGHKYCFSCHHFEDSCPSIEYMRKKDKKDIKNTYVSLPDDFHYNIGDKGILWLKRYNLSYKEIINNKFGWSEEGVWIKGKTIHIAPLLVFPVFDKDGHLLMWQGRNFGENKPKYITKGAKNVLHILGRESSQVPDSIILTEDLISAIKVSRVTPSMPLWGSFISLEDAKRLSERFAKAILWLDKDKAQEAFKQAQKLSYLFKGGVSCIRTERDPKEYSTQQLQEYLK